MRLGKLLTSLIKPELEELRELLNLTDDELKVFDELARGKTKTEIAFKCDSTVPTVGNRIKTISSKIDHLKEVMNSVDRK